MLAGACADRPLPAQLTTAALLGDRKMMADSESIEEVAVIGNTDITPTESENNISNTVVLSAFFPATFLESKYLVCIEKTLTKYNYSDVS